MLLAACGGQGPQAVHPEPAPQGEEVSLAGVAPFFVAGESMTWEVTFRGIEGGRARVAIGAPVVVDGRRVLALSAEAESSGLLAAVKEIRDDQRAWIDADTGAPVRSESEANTSGKLIKVQTVFTPDGKSAALAIQIGAGAARKMVRKLPDGGVYDPLGVLLVMRAWRAPVGARTGFYTLGGQRLWRTQLTVEGVEELRTPLGKSMTVKLTGVSTRLHASGQIDASKPPRKFTVWVTDDERRIPVKIRAHTELGDLDVTATSYDVPAAPAVSAR